LRRLLQIFVILGGLLVVLPALSIAQQSDYGVMEEPVEAEQAVPESEEEAPSSPKYERKNKFDKGRISGRIGNEILQKGCEADMKPEVTVDYAHGEVYISQTRTMFQIARKKGLLYGKKMPEEQGSLGDTILSTETDMKFRQLSRPGCLGLERLNVKVSIDNRFEIAREFAFGSCLYDEFYNYEREMMLIDIDFIKRDLDKFREDLRFYFLLNPTFGPFPFKEHDARINENLHNEVDKVVKKYLGELNSRLLIDRAKRDTLDESEAILETCMDE
jgi:hypothetical protein